MGSMAILHEAQTFSRQVGNSKSQYIAVCGFPFGFIITYNLHPHPYVPHSSLSWSSSLYNTAPPEPLMLPDVRDYCQHTDSQLYP